MEMRVFSHCSIFFSGQLMFEAVQLPFKASLVDKYRYFLNIVTLNTVGGCFALIH